MHKIISARTSGFNSVWNETQNTWTAGVSSWLTNDVCADKRDGYVYFVIEGYPIKWKFISALFS